MRCAICGRLPSEECSKKTHFVHDYMYWLDGTRSIDGALVFGLPRGSWPSIREWLLREWADYTTSPRV